MIVCLHKVSRNLNRAYRTCEAFGVGAMELHQCHGRVQGNLFMAKGRVLVAEVNQIEPCGLLVLETSYQRTIYEVDWSAVERILIGGETAGVPTNQQGTQFARIPMFGLSSGLTVEAALAIVLSEWRRNI